MGVVPFVAVAAVLVLALVVVFPVVVALPEGGRDKYKISSKKLEVEVCFLGYG